MPSGKMGNGFTVVDVGDDREVADMGLVKHIMKASLGKCQNRICGGVWSPRPTGSPYRCAASSSTLWITWAVLWPRPGAAVRSSELSSGSFSADDSARR